jgi:nucleoside-diphosphate-sugar epimerase
MNVLITGAGGFVGKAVVEVFKDRHHLRLFDQTQIPIEAPHESVAGNIADIHQVMEAMEGIEGVVNLAIANEGYGSETELPNDRPMDVSVKGTFNILETARRHTVRRIVHMSSGAVVTGYGRETYIYADIPHKFTGLYPLTKHLQEQLCRAYAQAYGMSIICLRPWSVVDGRERMTKGYGGKPGAPLKKESYNFGLICRYDLAEACDLALKMEDAHFEVFHTMPTAEGRKSFDQDRTEQALGWKPVHDFEPLRRGEWG